MLVERHLALAGIRLHIVELIVINTFVDDDAIAKDILPPKGKNFTRTHGCEDDQRDHRLRRFLHRLDHPADVR
ncbi:MAG: hypothetical protein ABSF16_07100 [Terracidiphilus sp.]